MVNDYVQMKFFAENDIQAIAQNLFHRSLTDGEFASLAGARPNDKVFISCGYNEGESYIQLKMIRPVTIGRRKPNIGIVSAVSIENDEPLLTIQIIQIPEELQKQGIGSDIIAVQVKAAQRIGIPRVAAYADNKEYLPGRRYIGYYALPRLGFDAQLTETQKQKLPIELANKASIGELMCDSNTRELWRMNGLPIEVTFDTSANSSSIYLLQNYFKEKGFSWEGLPDASPQVLRVTT